MAKLPRIKVYQPQQKLSPKAFVDWEFGELDEHFLHKFACKTASLVINEFVNSADPFLGSPGMLRLNSWDGHFEAGISLRELLNDKIETMEDEYFADEGIKWAEEFEAYSKKLRKKAAAVKENLGD